jgi:NitT/TauT family transport system permease protein
VSAPPHERGDTPPLAWRGKTVPGSRHRALARYERAVAAVSPAVMLLLWEAVARLLDPRFFPSPSAIVGTFHSVLVNGELLNHVVVTAARIGIGYAMGAVPAVVLGLVIGRWSLLKAFTGPIIFALSPVPKVAVLPLIMMIFGLGEMSKYVTVAIAVFFIVLVNTIAGVVEINQIYLDVAKNFNARRVDLYRRVILPGALPGIFTGLKVGMTIALIVIVTAEFVGAKAGIGVMVFESWQLFAIERLYVGLVAIAFLGFILSVLFEELERLVIPWRARG